MATAPQRRRTVSQPESGVLHAAGTEGPTAPVAQTHPLDLSHNARVVLERRYLLKDDDGNAVEQPEEMFTRVAATLAGAESRYGADEARVTEVRDAFYDLMTRLDFLPNSPTLSNAGRPLGQLSACFVLPVGDSLGEIFDTVKHAALIHQSGGGTGFSFSRLRPEGSIVRSTLGVASGPVSFMKVIDGATEAIKQGGVRRGANMGILRVDHPDIESFIAMKSDMTTLQNFNISVAITEKFMQAVDAGTEYELINPHNGQVAGTKDARDLWERLIANAWKNGDPGLIFIDRINEGKANPVPSLGPVESTNPCGEQPLYPYDSCNLGSINLSKFVTGAAGSYEVDWERLGEVVGLCVRLLDNVIDQNRYPLAQIEEVSRTIRRIGLGVMGWADLLYILNVPYDSDDAVELAGRVMAHVQASADRASGALAAERGVFPTWEESVYGPHSGTPWQGTPLRNSTRTTIAPTGTLSIIADCSGGIEPVFSLAFTRQHYLDPKNPTVTTKLTEVNKHFEEVARREGFYSEDLIQFLAEGGHLTDREDVPEWVKQVFVTAHDIVPEWHVRMQGAFQEFTDNAVSKTINFANEATVEDVTTAYTLAYQLGAKGITIYRDGSRAMQVLSHDKKEEKPAEVVVVVEQVAAPAVVVDEWKPRRQRLPDERQSITHKFQVGEQEGYITVGLFEDGRPGEVFLRVSKQGSTVSGLMESLGQLTSIALQYGVPLDGLTTKMKNSRFEPSGLTGNRDVPTATSLVDYVYKWLERRFGDRDAAGNGYLTGGGYGYSNGSGSNGHANGGSNGASNGAAASNGYSNGTNGHSNGAGSNGYTNGSGSNGHANGNGAVALVESTAVVVLNTAHTESGVGCPECGSLLHYAEGCMTCRACGYTKCG